jgi:hypothetical protein
MPEMLPVETVPELVPMIVSLIDPLPGLLSSGAVKLPALLPMETLLVVPWPAAVIDPLFVVTDMPLMDPVETVPVLVPMIVSLIDPLPGVLSSGAVKLPALLPMETLLVVP